MVRCTDRSAMTIAVDWDVKQQKQTNKDIEVTQKTFKFITNNSSVNAENIS